MPTICQWTEAVYIESVVPYYFPGVGLSLNGMTLTNNSIVTNTVIGTDTAALLCTTTYTPCCSSDNQETQWYFPNGSQVPNNPALPYRRTRGPGRVILSRNTESTTTGIFHCDIPDANGVTQSLYVGIYDMNTGESCTLKEWFIICEEVAGTQDEGSTFHVCNSICVQYATLVVWYTMRQKEAYVIMCSIHKRKFNLVGSNARIFHDRGVC